MGDSVTIGIGRGFAFATGLPVTLCSTFSREMVSDVSVTYLSIPFTIRTQETVLSRNRDSTMISIPYLFLMEADVHIQDRAEFSCFRESTLALGMLLRIEAAKTLDIDSSFHLVLLLHQVQLRVGVRISDKKSCKYFQ